MRLMFDGENNFESHPMHETAPPKSKEICHPKFWATLPGTATTSPAILRNIQRQWRFRKSWGYPQFSSISIGFSSINLEKTIQPLGYPRDLGWFQGPPVSVRNALLQAQPVIGGNYGTLSTLNNHSIGDAIGYIL